MKRIFVIVLVFACAISGFAQRNNNNVRIANNSKQSSAPKKQTMAQQRKVTGTFSNGVLTVNGVNYPMVNVQGGTFTMGATSEQGSYALENDEPTHQVTLTNNYFIGKTEVTQAFWKAVMGSNPSYYKGENKPVELVSWNDCMTFISKLNSMTGKRFRLPTEAEWEFASRGGINSQGYTYSGSNTLDDVAWYTDNSDHVTHDVATKQPNELGIYDMSGNVCEWCSDWHDNYSSSSQTNPIGPRSGSGRVIRNGSYCSIARSCRLSSRDKSGTPSRFSRSNLGLRLVLSE